MEIENKKYAAWMVELFEARLDEIVADLVDGFLSGGYLTIRQDTLDITIQERDKWLALT